MHGATLKPDLQSQSVSLTSITEVDEVTLGKVMHPVRCSQPVEELRSANEFQIHCLLCTANNERGQLTATCSPWAQWQVSVSSIRAICPTHPTIYLLIRVPSEMLRRVVWQMLAGVSEDLTASISDDQRFKGFYCCHHQESPWWLRQFVPLKSRSISTRLHGATSKKTAIFTLVTVRTWNHTVYLWMQAKVSCNNLWNLFDTRICNVSSVFKQRRKTCAYVEWSQRWISPWTTPLHPTFRKP
jgi:hypothetical protein